ncbi:MAG: Hsp20/alpha crystallin family protein [Campylobacteraceae bacterium]|nr:Hsp20/alpha crystallin family protein [Campylobacteraceae bacterium]
MHSQESWLFWQDFSQTRVKSEYKEEIKEKDYYKLESFYGKFQISFALPEDTDGNSIDASSENGVLNIVIPKAAPKESKKIEIK